MMEFENGRECCGLTIEMGGEKWREKLLCVLGEGRKEEEGGRRVSWAVGGEKKVKKERKNEEEEEEEEGEEGKREKRGLMGLGLGLDFLL